MIKGMFTITNEMKSCKDAYKAYKDYCAKSGFRPESYERFRRQVLNKRKNKGEK